MNTKIELPPEGYAEYLTGEALASMRLLAALRLSASEILFSAFRYYLGRRTIATCAFADDLAAAWEHIDEPQQKMMAEEIAEAIARGRAGDPCDVQSWQRVLSANDLEQPPP